ncbi:Triacylglycerol lipase precursor [Actinokineospora spheciospongiae]|uniref:Triacylglycerol lipase n=1 Tax=Actinokineospora spheciospongiae TaxID=909613 RepID=W7IYK7_9PSEU|nr:CocE/NonD family hydrolase [Actinokineospora spheciospongiae]EWC61561.1 Triacylglycerol lipase precursor [Actinokineospora spheciospongiae]
MTVAPRTGRRSLRGPLGLLAAAALTAGALVGVDASAAENPYQRGPEPTVQSLEAAAGPFAVESAPVQAGAGFAGGTVYYPADTGEGTFGGLAVSPGFLEVQAAISWLGPRLASHGFVVVTIDTLSPFDQPAARADQLLATLDWLTTASPVKDRVDANRLGVLGHSMGGGASLAAAKKRPSLLATVPLAPWNTVKDWAAESVPSLIVGAENDTIAGVTQHAEPFYESLGGEKAYLELRGADHFVVTAATPTVGKFTVAWLKRWIDSDTRYDRFLCPAPAPDAVISEFRETCPLG